MYTTLALITTPAAAVGEEVTARRIATSPLSRGDVGDIAELVVNALKRSELAQGTPVSIAVRDGANLQQQGIKDLF